MSKWDGIHTDKAFGIAGQAVSFWAAVKLVVPAITTACILASIFLVMRPTLQRQQFEHEAYLDRQRTQRQADEEKLAEQRRAAMMVSQEQRREHAYTVARYRREHPEDSLVRSWEDYLAKQKVDAEQRAIREAERDTALKRHLGLEAAREARLQEQQERRATRRFGERQPRAPADSVTLDERDAQDWDKMQRSVSADQQVDNMVQVNGAGMTTSGEAHDDAVTAEKAREVRRWRRIRGRAN